MTKIIEDPVGMLGKKIDLGYWSIDGDDQAIQSGLNVISNYSLEVNDLILSSIASATMMAGPDLRRAGTLVIDMGAGVSPILFSTARDMSPIPESFPSGAIMSPETSAWDSACSSLMRET